MTLPVTVIMSLWRNDAHRRIHERVEHLLSKVSTKTELRWLWAVGDSTDYTEDILRAYAAVNQRITVVRHDVGVQGEANAPSRLRTATTASRMFNDLPADAALALLHESDLHSPHNVVDLLLATDKLPIAGWPVIDIGNGEQFYDLYAYRSLHGLNFTPDEPRRPRVFEVGSFGSLWLAPASLVRGRVLDGRAIVSLCEQWRDEGVKLWVDPRVTVTQPSDLWTWREVK